MEPGLHPSNTLPTRSPGQASPRKNLRALTLAAIGVVYGDIGTSPLYALQGIIFGGENKSPTESDIIGSLSLVVWALTLAVAIKYLTLVLRADNDGQGGVFALYSKLHRFKDRRARYLKILLMLAAGLLFGEAMITPAISVLSAVEGARLLAPDLSRSVVGVTIVILLMLFAIQRFGSSRMGRFFGPIALVWFLVIGGLGTRSIMAAPKILLALNPWYGLQYIVSADLGTSLFRLGALVLVITGGEALFADMGHFGARAIRFGWFCIVMPALLLNYLGQGSFLLANPDYVPNVSLFFSLSPANALWPLIGLSTVAAVIASQALISGAFSLSSQAVALGLFPRIRTVQTHQDHFGQTYVPVVNTFLLVGAISLAAVFQSSAALAGAYGFALSVVMLVTSLVMLMIAGRYWRWSVSRRILVFAPFLVIDAGLLLAKGTYFRHGGYVSTLVGLFVFFLMWSWAWGRKATFAAYTNLPSVSIRDLIGIKENSSTMLRKNVIFMAPKTPVTIDDAAPPLVQMYLNRHHFVPEHIFLVQVVHKKSPYVHTVRHESVVFYKSPEKGSIIAVTIYFGFMEDPNVEKVLEQLAVHHEVDLPKDPHRWLVHVSHEYLIKPKDFGLVKTLKWHVFLFLRQVTLPAYYAYGLGRDVNLSVDIMPVFVPPESSWPKLLRR
jgi:KUP system potassium uptake protein